MNQLVLYRDGQAVNLNEMPSLLAVLHANNRAVVSTKDEIAAKEAELVELEERLRLHEELKLTTQGIKGLITRRRNELADLDARLSAHESNYIEVPDMGGQHVRFEGQAFWDYETNVGRQNLPTAMPLDVLRALKHAKDSGLFSDFKVFEPGRDTVDPMIVGVAGGATFYVASWR